MIIRAKTKTLFSGKELSERQKKNTELNMCELEAKAEILESYPRRLVFELTNACNLNCIMCGRNAAKFKPTAFDMEVFRSFEPMMDIVEEVTLMGWGEPTIHPHFIEMLEIIHRHGARKYFCTNGMNLKQIKKALFDYEVDVFAVSVDGATKETNNRIRKGSDLDMIVRDLKEIEREKKEQCLSYPYINFVFCAMKSNLHELPDLIRLAADIGIEEVKVVYLTVFGDDILNESLWGQEEEVRSVFGEAAQIGEELGILLKLPYISGEDEATEKLHKECYVSWRDFFLGSDGYVRPCMSTPVQFFRYDVKNRPEFMSVWNAPEYQKYRSIVNDPEKMENPCRRCYQSSYCNWNKKESFIQIGENFSPEWESENKGLGREGSL
ncbi:radical SAM protein [Parasporobacterium paucivorans]|uniref:Radical SAM additional 4Fe4S-binding SPASM domain-containing protein n=1 Tax=Parasporobacterium paucivorans DSM 15970 TaxID=1122934 RepID=A0A1M6GVX1_9FIRM|nr:radical SAM protein [Parasporobacterium paucivorans]SHJ14076.1 radical SAM additional 4Fe4S-binding SPASM domain-containing protein [Parasporobacterium paucivorans DSM 15970]